MRSLIGWFRSLFPSRDLTPAETYIHLTKDGCLRCGSNFPIPAVTECEDYFRLYCITCDITYGIKPKTKTGWRIGNVRR